MTGERTLPGIGLTGFWTEGSDGWGAQNDENLRKLSAICQASVVSRTTALPASPAEPAVYLVPAGASSNANDFAVWDDGAWVYITPKAGWLTYVQDTGEYARFDGTAWAPLETGGAGGIPDAPSDGEVYGRKDGAWVIVPTSSGGGSGGTGGDPLGFARFTPPPETGWTTEDNGGVPLRSEYDSDAGAYVLLTDNGTTSSSVTAYLPAEMPTGTDWTRIVRCQFLVPEDNHGFVGITLRNSANEKRVNLGVFHALGMYRQYFTGTSFNGEAAISAPNFSKAVLRFSDLYFRFQRSGNALTADISLDGLTWYATDLNEDVVSGHLGGDVDGIGLQIQTSSVDSDRPLAVVLKGLDDAQQPQAVSGSGGSGSSTPTGATLLDSVDFSVNNATGQHDFTGLNLDQYETFVVLGRDIDADRNFRAQLRGSIDDGVTWRNGPVDYRGGYTDARSSGGGQTDRIGLSLESGHPKSFELWFRKRGGRWSVQGWHYDAEDGRYIFHNIQFDGLNALAFGHFGASPVYNAGTIEIYSIASGGGSGGSGGGIAEAPNDGALYARKNEGWETFVPGIADAPSDGKGYVRKDGGWVEETIGDGGSGGSGGATPAGYQELQAFDLDTTSQAGTVDFTGLGLDQYDHLILAGNAIDASANFRSQFLVSTDDGATWEANIYDEGYNDGGTNGLTIGRPLFNMTLESGGPHYFEVHLRKFDTARWSVHGWVYDGINMRYVAGFVRASFNALRFFFTGNGGITWNAGSLKLFAATGGGSGGATGVTVDEETASFNLADSDLAGNVVKKIDNASAVTLTIPAGLTGTEPVTLVQTGVGQVTISPATGVTVNAPDGANKTRVRYSNAVLLPDGADNYILMGDIVA